MAIPPVVAPKPPAVFERAAPSPSATVGPELPKAPQPAAEARLEDEKRKLAEDQRKADEARLAAAKTQPATPVPALVTPALPETPNPIPEAVGIATVLKELAPLLAQNKFADATALLERKLRDPALASAAELLKQEQADIEAAAEMRKQAVEAIRKLAGRTITLKQGAGTLTGKVKDDSSGLGVALEVSGALLTLRTEQIHVDDLDAYAPIAAGGQPVTEPGQRLTRPEDLRRRGLLFLYAGNAPKAKEFFTQARDAGLGAAATPYLDRITALEVGETEAAALKSWERAEQLFAAKNMKAAQEAYAAFERDHAKSQTVAKQATALKERYAALEAALGPPPALALELGGGIKMELVLVKAGEFEMGSNDGRGEEKPVHKVKLSRPYYLGKYEVTVAQFRTFAEAAKYKTEAEKSGSAFAFKDARWVDVKGINWRTPGFPQEETHPVCTITWHDAQEFLNWATKKTGRKIALPTEAQWEYACRAGSTSKFSAGEKESDLEQVGWIGKNSGQRTNLTGQKKPNAWGLYDMHGNVWEWVQDHFSDKYYTEAQPVDPQGPARGSARVLRGGGWRVDPESCRSARRHRGNSADRSADVGFRVALDY